MDSLKFLRVEDNRFTFSNSISQIQSIQGQLSILSYQPQDSIYQDTTINLTTGQSLDLDLLVDEGLSSNSHQWYKDGATMNASIIGDNNLRITNAQENDEGVYRVEITNPGLPDLTLYSHSITINVQLSCLEADSLWLVNFYNSTRGPNWTRNDNWLAGPVNSWYGITLTDDGCGVKGIDFSNNDEGNNLSGILPILNLNSLEVFMLNNNELSGSIPLLDQVPNLVRIDVSRNQLSGLIPTLNQVPNMTHFIAHNNTLNGSIPILDQTPNMIHFAIDHNELSGPIPALNNLSQLEIYAIHNNVLSGSLPELDQVPSLRDFSALNNNLSGELPAFDEVPNLQSFWVSATDISGTVPNLDNVPVLERLAISDNNLSGNFPDLSSKGMALHLPTWFLLQAIP